MNGSPKGKGLSCSPETAKMLGDDVMISDDVMHHDVTDEIDALPKDMRYSNFDLLCTTISILTYIFDLVSKKP